MHARILERAAALGFTSLAKYAADRPRASLVALAVELTGPIRNDEQAGLAPIDQLISILLEQARDDGTISWTARDLLVRALHQKLPDGWPWSTDLPARQQLGSCLMAWASTIGAHLPEYRRCALDTALALLSDPVPAGWLPSDPDDRLLVALFREHWD